MQHKEGIDASDNADSIEGLYYFPQDIYRALEPKLFPH